MFEKPDGRWAWLVVLAAAAIRIILYGITHTSGVVYMVVLDVFKRGKGETSWITSIITAATFSTCPLSGILVNRFGPRPVAFCGGLLACAGLLASAFARTLPVLAIFYGVVTGIGCGLTYIPGSVAVAKYFTTRRNFAMGLSAAGGGIGTFAFPPIVKFLNDYFGWRGMFLILSGCALNILVFAMLYRPVEETEMFVGSVDHLETVGKKDCRNSKESRCGFITNLDFHVIGLSSFLFNFGTSVIFGHLGTFSMQVFHIDEDRSTLLYSYIGISTTVFKLSQGILLDKGNRWKVCHPYIINIYSFLLGGVALTLLLFDTGYAGLVIFSLFFGLSYAANGGSVIPAILINLESVEQLSLTYGIILFLQALGFLLGSPVAGMLIDSSKTYNTALIMAGIAIIVSSIILIFPCRNFYQNPPKEIEDRDFSVKVITRDETIVQEPASSDSGVHEDVSLLDSRELECMMDRLNDEIGVVVAADDEHNGVVSKHLENEEEQVAFLQTAC